MNKRVVTASVVMFLVALCPCARATNSVVNGDFSLNAAGFTNFPGYATSPNPTNITSWTLTGAGVGINGQGIQTVFGPIDQTGATYYAFLQNAGSKLTQTIYLKPQTGYFIGFIAANRSGNLNATGRVVVADSVTNFYDSGPTSWSTGRFELVTASFTAPGIINGPVTITLQNASGPADNTVCFSDVSIDPVLFNDDFNSAKSTSLTSPKGRSSGSVRSAIGYAWTSTTDVQVDGALNWDANGDKNANNEQPSANGTQAMRITNNLAPYVAGKVWEVEFDQRTAWSHPLMFGLSDTAANGDWNGWDLATYDFAAGQYGDALRYDTDNDNGTAALSAAGVFPTPVTNTFYHFRIQFDEPRSSVTVWVNNVERCKLTTLDFENSGRYLSWGEPTHYAGALDNIKISLYLPEYVPPPGMVISVR